MHAFACLLQPEVKRQPAKHIEASASTGDEDVLCFFQFVEEWDSHSRPAVCVIHSTSTPLRSAIPITAWVPELNSKKSFSMPSLKITPFSAICDWICNGISPVIRPNTSDAPVVRVGN